MTPFSRAVRARVDTVQRNTRWSGQVALYTMAAGVSGAYPPAISSSWARSSRPVDRNSTMVQPWEASLRSFSPSGTGVRPSIRVMMTDWDTSGRVYSASRAAAAPQKEDTPGVTS